METQKGRRGGAISSQLLEKNVKKYIIRGILDYSGSYCNTLLAAIKISKTKNSLSISTQDLLFQQNSIV